MTREEAFRESYAKAYKWLLWHRELEEITKKNLIPLLMSHLYKAPYPW